jgi:hypothetical protein
MELFLIYAWLKLDTICDVLTCIAAISGVSAFILIAIKADAIDNRKYSFTNKELNEAKIIQLGKTFSKVFNVFIVSGVLAVFLPSSKDTAILVASSYAIDMVKSPTGAKVYKLLQMKIESAIDEEIKSLEKKNEASNKTESNSSK